MENVAEDLNTQQDQEELESFVLEKTDFKKRLKSAGMDHTLHNQIVIFFFQVGRIHKVK